jgi:hypothetical protein
MNTYINNMAKGDENLVRQVIEVFTYIDEDGKDYHFAMPLLKRYADAFADGTRNGTLPTIELPIDQELVNGSRAKRGVEQEILDGMSDDRMNDPIYSVIWHGTELLVVDGHHRLVKRWDKGLKTVNTVIFPEEIWRKCLIVPADKEDHVEILQATKEQRRIKE